LKAWIWVDEARKKGKKQAISHVTYCKKQ